MKHSKLFKKYTPEELAEAFVFRVEETPEEKAINDRLMFQMAEESRANRTPEQTRLGNLYQLKFKIEDYIASPEFDETRSFGHFLNRYLEIINLKKKDFAQNIGIAATELSQILNHHRKPTEKILIRLEIHSNAMIPALTWLKLVQKESEHELRTNMNLRNEEKKHVRNALTF